MDDEARRARIRQFVEALNTRDLEWFDALYHDDVVIHWPQSGEAIRGKHRIRELRQAYPTPPTATLGRIIGSGDLWATEMEFDYDGDRFHVVVIHQWRDGWWPARPPTTRPRSRRPPGGPSGSSRHQAPRRADHRLSGALLPPGGARRQAVDKPGGR